MTEDLTFNIDQIETLAYKMTPVFGSYYNGLIENGIPEALAREMVRDYARVLWTSAKGGSGVASDD